jgi:hypothetical protein
MWQETLEKNPANRERLLAMDPEAFGATMEAWGPGWLGYPASAEELTKIEAPTLVFHGSPTDFWHLRSTSEWLHEHIRGSRLVEPPWSDEEWNHVAEESLELGYSVHFKNWWKLAPQLIDFIDEPVP